MSYDQSRITRHRFVQHDFGGSNDVRYFRGPKGKSGRLIDFGVESITEAFAGASTTPIVAIGNSSDPDAYGEEFDFGALAETTGGKSVRTTYDTNAEIEAVILPVTIPADTVVYATITAATNSPTGIADLWVDIQWAD